MSRITLKALSLAAFLSLAGPVEAATFFKATLLGVNENPPISSPGSGTALLTLDGDFLTINIAFQDLLGTTVASHIHCCATAPTNAGVATPVPSFPGFPFGVSSGSYLQTFNLTLLSSYNPAFVTANGGTALSARNAFVAGLTGSKAYVNVHTTRFPGGEIRGQLAVVPEPQTWAMMIIGFGLAGAALRRRRALAPA